MPVVPTPEMPLAGNNGIDDDIDSWNFESDAGYRVEPQAARNVYDRMLAVAPEYVQAGKAQ